LEITVQGLLEARIMRTKAMVTWARTSPNNKRKQPKSTSKVDGPSKACEEEYTKVMYKGNEGNLIACITYAKV
jgi:hypothetical protein